MYLSCFFSMPHKFEYLLFNHLKVWETFEVLKDPKTLHQNLSSHFMLKRKRKHFYSLFYLNHEASVVNRIWKYLQNMFPLRLNGLIRKKKKLLNFLQFFKDCVKSWQAWEKARYLRIYREKNNVHLIFFFLLLRVYSNMLNLCFCRAILSVIKKKKKVRFNK